MFVRLAVALLAHREHERSAPVSVTAMPTTSIGVVRDVDRLHADRARAPSSADLVLGEANRLTELRGNEELARAIGERRR